MRQLGFYFLFVWKQENLFTVGIERNKVNNLVASTTASRREIAW